MRRYGRKKQFETKEEASQGLQKLEEMFSMDKDSFQALWIQNIHALLILGEIKNDNMNGYMSVIQIEAETVRMETLLGMYQSYDQSNSASSSSQNKEEETSSSSSSSSSSASSSASSESSSSSLLTLYISILKEF